MSDQSSIEYTDSVADVTPEQLHGFFAGWPITPPPELHLAALRGSDHVVLARDGDRVVGFVTAIGDGVLSASIPLLEVLPDYQGRGIGSELVRRVLAQLESLYMVDVSCEADLESFYEQFGLRRLARGMGVRRPEALAAR